MDDRGAALSEEIRRRLGIGVGLEPHVRERFEGRLGGDLSSAMVHRSALGGRLARALGARAFTVHQSVVGGADDLDPTSPRGEALLAHELTHVVQRQDDEPAAASVEHSVRAESAGVAAAGATIDPEALAERVYQRLLRELRLERDRAAGSLR
jgi:hypothetical protein